MTDDNASMWIPPPEGWARIPGVRPEDVWRWDDPAVHRHCDGCGCDTRRDDVQAS